MANGMSSDWIDRLRDSVDIVDVVGDYVLFAFVLNSRYDCR